MEVDELARLLEGSRLDEFDVVSKIGGKDVTQLGGGMATTLHGVCSYVYLVRSRRAGVEPPLALKVMINMLGGDQTSDLREQHAAEYKLLSDPRRLARHPGIIAVLHRFVDEATKERLPGYEFDPQDVSPRTTFVVMPLCDKGDLKSEMKRLSRAGEYFQEARVRSLMRQLLSAIVHLKRNRIAHRDIKADNVMLQTAPDDQERLVLIDFGQCLD